MTADTGTWRWEHGVGPEPCPCHAKAVTHLAGRYGTACGLQGKYTTTSAAAVTCEACRATWAWAATSRAHRSGKSAR